jgi:DNA mismatch repair protein MutS
VDAELDELLSLSVNSKQVLADIQQREAINTGINSLKIGYNNVFGYYLEVTNTHKDRVPQEWIRKQTLTNGERYITEELKALETKILGAQDRILEIESKLFNELVVGLLDYIPMIQLNARIIARMDVLLCFAHVSLENHYNKPEINESTVINIKNGRHPVIEKRLPYGENYITNDIYLDNENQQIIIITGPNMSGKSALLRQTALIVLMAQMGCFVPAESAAIGIVDKIFTRVGASDSISTGESTFMVEMNETASILNNISNRSLILLDEIGRGTSTYDGVSIAWSIAEYLHEHPQYRAKVLFATHYHELNDMTEQFSRIKNFHVTVKEINNKVLFLRKLEKGGSEHSFGIHVARMAGMPQKVLRRADEILKQLEKSRSGNENEKTKITKKEPGYQLSFIALDDPLLIDIKDRIMDLDINSLTPVEALMTLNDIKGMLGKKKKN